MRLPPCALVLALFFAGCPADDDSETAAQDSSASEPTTAADSSASGDDHAALGCAWPEMIDTTDGATAPLQDSWGAACTTDDECVALLGMGAECLTLAVVFELPGGYCSKPCTLPDADTRFVLDDPTCDPAGGVACVGSTAGMFEHCAKLCTDDTQCNRDGYVCRQMPLIAFPDDPSLCLMPDCCGMPNSTCAND